MPRRPSPLSLAACGCSGLARVLLAAAPARAQDQRKKQLPSGDSETDFLKHHSASKAVFNTINRPQEGEKAKKDNPEHKAAIDMAAQYYTYRLTWDSVTSAPDGVDKFMSEFFSQVLSANSA